MWKAYILISPGNSVETNDFDSKIWKRWTEGSGIYKKIETKNPNLQQLFIPKQTWVYSFQKGNIVMQDLFLHYCHKNA